MTHAELTAKYAAQRAELHRQLDALSARQRGMAIVTIPAALRPAGPIDRESTYVIQLPDGRVAVAAGAELVRVADDLGRLAAALDWAGEPTIRRFLRRLQGSGAPGRPLPRRRRYGR